MSQPTHGLLHKLMAPMEQKLRRWMLYLRWGGRILVVIALIDLGYLMGVWPDWSLYDTGPIQRSNPIREYIAEQPSHPDWPPLQWHPVSLDHIAPEMARAVVVAEDSRFYQHDGFDTEAFKKAMEYNMAHKRLVYGASTISQQTVKNLFLNPSRNPLRKWHEVWITLGMERNLSKKRILELYLNVAEFGRGIYGVEAAARHYWGVHAADLTPRQAAQLAATLPAPVNHNPTTRTEYFVHRQKKLMRYLGLS